MSLAPSEDDCIICGKWPEKDRCALREMIDSLPLHEEPICDECLRNFWRRIVERPDSGSKHQGRSEFWPGSYAPGGQKSIAGAQAVVLSER